MACASWRGELSKLPKSRVLWETPEQHDPSPARVRVVKGEPVVVLGRRASMLIGDRPMPRRDKPGYSGRLSTSNGVPQAPSACSWTRMPR